MFLDQYSPILPDNEDRTLIYICQFLHIFAQSLLSLEKSKGVHEDVE